MKHQVTPEDPASGGEDYAEEIDADSTQDAAEAYADRYIPSDDHTVPDYIWVRAEGAETWERYAVTEHTSYTVCPSEGCTCATLPPERDCCDVCNDKRQAAWEAEMRRSYDAEMRQSYEQEMAREYGRERVCPITGEDLP